MIEWLDGYWTAIKHVSILSGWGSPVEWAAAIGSIVAALAAAFAAWQSLRAARQSNVVMTESERAAILQQASSTFYEIEYKSENVAKIIRPLKANPFPNDISQLKAELIEELEGDWQAYSHLQGRCSQSLQSVLAAKNLLELSKIKQDLLFIYASAREIDSMTSNRQNNAKINGIID
ncbi:hypothetical protein LZ686_17095 [Paracoccus sp. NFXS7]|uniref:hypothetical protein n=1 Tax=Paracoccus sp. NFXS7 TaxID=2908653 RepID=UPI0032E024BA